MSTNRPKRPRGPTQKDIKSAATRARLVEAARELFEEFGYNEVSVTDIARAAGVSHAMINVYFNSKAGLLYHIIHEGNEAQIGRSETIVAMSGTMHDRLEAMVRMFAAHEASEPDLWGVMMAYYWTWPPETEKINQPQVREALSYITQILRGGIANGELSESTDPERATAVFYALYLMGFRPATFGHATVVDCINEICAQLRMVFRP